MAEQTVYGSDMLTVLERNIMPNVGICFKFKPGKISPYYGHVETRGVQSHRGIKLFNSAYGMFIWNTDTSSSILCWCYFYREKLC